MLTRLKARLRREKFITSPLAIVISPVYIIRAGIYKGILSKASRIGGDILDLGCGSKPYESLFTNASSYLGIDTEVSGHDHSRSKADLYYDGKTIPFPDNRFDAVVSFEVFEHVFHIDELLCEVKRVLKPGGHVLMTVPFAWDEHEIPYDFARYTSFGIRHVLERNKIEVVEVKKTTTYFLAICQMFIAYISQYIFSRKNSFARALTQLVFIFPLNLAALSLNCILPRRYEYFCNLIVLGRNVKDGISIGDG
jgi:SAM-dependent methyltransferase